MKWKLKVEAVVHIAYHSTWWNERAVHRVEVPDLAGRLRRIIY